jgi:hypothetical protein
LATLLSNGHSPESLVSVATPLPRSLKDHGERNVNSRSSSDSVGRTNLQTVHDGLIACRRLVGTAVAENYWDDGIGRSAEI